MTQELLIRRIDDLVLKAENAVPGCTPFLNETQRAQAEIYLRRYRDRDGLAYRFYGGYEGAQRTRLFVYPDYYEFEDVCDSIGAVLIKGSGYESLKHSSFLGALTGLGIDRGKMGDIAVRGNDAILFADESIVRFLLSEPSPLTGVGRDKVKVSAYDVSADFRNDAQFKELFDTVASPRLDCIVASLAGVSREKAKGLVLSGSVMVNHIPKEAIDITVSDGDTVTIRGYGKFIIVSLADKTKKDRHKLIARKYI